MEQQGLMERPQTHPAAGIECPVCGMPSLDPPMQHYLGCPRHDPETCHACRAPYSAPLKRNLGMNFSHRPLVIGASSAAMNAVAVASTPRR
jgi:hypothetical protein